MNLVTMRWSYYISTALMTALMCMSVYMYLTNHEGITKIFEELGYPGYLVYPLATLKVLGLIAIWSDVSVRLKEWAYAGFFYDFVLALFAHIMNSDGQHMTAVLALILLMISYVSWRKGSGSLSGLSK